MGTFVVGSLADRRALILSVCVSLGLSCFYKTGRLTCTMKPTFSFLALAAALLLSGCSQTLVSNLTPQRLPENPSGIYTFTLSTGVDRNRIVDDTVKAAMVVNGQEIPMAPIAGSSSLYELDFRMPPGQTEVRYFYKLNYQTNESGITRDHEEKSNLYTSQLVNRYVLSLESDRGPVGATIAVVGRGFSQYDTIVVGDQEASTRYFSPNSLQFTVPAVEGGKRYDVYLRTGNGDLLVGSFLVDASQLQVLPASLDIISGGKALLVFSVDHEAPVGGLPVDVKTSIPSSVVMPEVIIAEGARSVSITVQGGPAAQGVIVATAPGYKSVTIPVVVR